MNPIVETKQSTSDSSKSMADDAGFSIVAKIIYLVTRLGIPPVILSYVSLAEYGLWSACFILVGYIGMADLGFSSVYVRLAARAHLLGDTGGIGKLLSTGIVCMAGIALLLLVAVLLSLPALMNALHIEESYRSNAKILIIGVVFVFLFDMCLNAFAYVLHGLQQFRAEQQVWMVAFLLEMAVIYILLLMGAGVLSLLIAFALRYAFSIVCNVRRVYRELPGLSVALSHFDRSLLNEFLRFGLLVQASSFFSMALHSVDRLIAGFFLGPQAIAMFDLGGKLPISATSIPAAITQITMPAAARLSFGQSDVQSGRAIAELYAKATRSVALVASLPLAFLAAFAVPLCFAWLGPRPELSAVPMLMALASLGAFLHITTGPGTSVFRGMGQMGNEFIYHALRVIALALSLLAAWLWMGLDLNSIAIALCNGTSIAALLYLDQNRRRLGFTSGHLWKRILLPAGASFCIASMLRLVWLQLVPASLDRWETLFALFVFGVAYCILAILAIWLFLDRIERAHCSLYAQRCGVSLKRWRTV
jgi:O-antigen/teichoic acid export membrane protein